MTSTKKDASSKKICSAKKKNSSAIWKSNHSLSILRCPSCEDCCNSQQGLPQKQQSPSNWTRTRLDHIFCVPFVYNLSSSMLWGQSPFKWQMGGTFEHVMWSSRSAQTAERAYAMYSGVFIHLRGLWQMYLTGARVNPFRCTISKD